MADKNADDIIFYLVNMVADELPTTTVTKQKYSSNKYDWWIGLIIVVITVLFFKALLVH